MIVARQEPDGVLCTQRMGVETRQAMSLSFRDRSLKLALTSYLEVSRDLC
jgi:hypothetical protein